MLDEATAEPLALPPPRLVVAGAREDDELLTAPAVHGVLAAARSAEHIGDLAQHVVPRAVTARG